MDRLLFKALLFIIVISFTEVKSFALEDEYSKKEVLEAIKRSQRWLESQIVPNNVVKNPVRDSFILSYQLSKDAKSYKYIYSKSSLYDNSLAVIAFMMVGNDRRAQKILKAVMRTAPDGELFFNYNTHNSWPDKNDRNGALIRNGASAWMGYAFSYYLKMKLKKDKNYQNTSEYKEFKNYLEKVIDIILEFKVENKNDNRRGLIRGGYGHYKLELKSPSVNPDKRAKTNVIERFYDEPIEWVSIEHCMDLYFLLKEAVALGLNQFEKELEFYSTRLIEKFWNKDLNQFNRGIRKEGEDPVEALDAASWAAVYFYSIGDLEKALKALRKTEAYLSKSNRWGHLPYINVDIFENSEVNNYLFSDGTNKKWNDLDFIWYEGSFGVLFASLKVKGVNKSNQKILRELIKEQRSDGSYVYATKEIPFQFSNRPSVASTAWFIIAASSFLMPEIRQSFWP